MRERFKNKGLPTCSFEQVTSEAGDAACAARNSANNAWYVNTNNGNRNNNNTYNRNRVCGASESIANCDEWVAAEKSAYKNKHHNFDAARVHFHLPELYAIAREVNSGHYRPRPMTAFVLTYPVYREAFAPHHLDCIVDHYTAPMLEVISEAVHAANGDISHGNRKEHSAQGMAERVVDDVRSVSCGYTKPCVIMHWDISAFFLSINRRKAYEMVERLSETYYDREDRLEKLAILKTTLLNDPLKDCVMKSPIGCWRHVPDHKTFFHGKPGYGLPIGKFPSQVVAGVYLSPLDCLFSSMDSIRAEHFVDDYEIIAPDARIASDAVAETAGVLDYLELRRHPKKIGVQPHWNGMTSCGRTVKGGRIYISRRTVRACEKCIEHAERSEAGALALRDSLNSYLGIMCHCAAWNIQTRVAFSTLTEFGKWLYFRAGKNHLVCAVRKRYSPSWRAKNEILKIINENSICYETRKTHQRNFHPRRVRGRKGGRRTAH